MLEKVDKIAAILSEKGDSKVQSKLAESIKSPNSAEVSLFVEQKNQATSFDQALVGSPNSTSKEGIIASINNHAAS